MTSTPTTGDQLSIDQLQVDQLRVQISADARTAGVAAGAAAAQLLRDRIAEQGRARVIFASAPSQDHALATLAAAPGIDWSRVTTFHMDEYVGLPLGHGQSFGRYLSDHLLDLVHPELAWVMDGMASAETELARYTAAITAAPIDLVLLGVGENGHVAFNEPGSAFNDPDPMRLVSLDLRSRQQQVNDGCFPILDEVPTQAYTLTVPTLIGARAMIAVVTGALKREAVTRMLSGEIDEQCPATVLRRHPQARLFVDLDASPEQLGVALPHG